MTDHEREIGAMAAQMGEVFRRLDRQDEQLVAQSKSMHEMASSLAVLAARIPMASATPSPAPAPELPLGKIGALAVTASAATSAAVTKLLVALGLQ